MLQPVKRYARVAFTVLSLTPSSFNSAASHTLLIIRPLREYQYFYIIHRSFQSG